MKNKSNWKHIRERVITDIDEMNKILKEVQECCSNIYFRKREQDELIRWNAYIVENGCSLTVTYKPFKKAITYKFDLDGKRITATTPVNAVSQMSRYYKIERTDKILDIDSVDIPECRALLYKNPKYDGKATKAYEYDLSAAYLQMLRLPLPKTATMQRNKVIGENQIGFVEIDGSLRLIESREEFDAECDYVFDIMQSPYIEFCDKLQNKIDTETDDNKKTDLKNIYRFAVGCLRNSNQFWRATIIERCNKLVESYFDENTIYCNTDSIISTVRRYDIEADTKFRWKLKHQGAEFKFQKGTLNYQWDLEEPAYRSQVKRYIHYYNETHEQKWDILKDPIPRNIEHEYSFDRKTLQIKEN